MQNQANCCGVSRERSSGDVAKAAPGGPFSTTGMVRLDGGSFLMGSDDVSFPSDGEGPVREITVNPFWIDTTTVTNAQFGKFIAETGYVTEAERFGWSFVFFPFLPKNAPPLASVPAAPWWKQVYGAMWRSPEGFNSTVDDRKNHPVVHMSWNDAVAYANWCGKRLPTEAEWEYAARGGLKQKRYPWGDTLRPGGKHRCNIWQGKFPLRNTKEDGYLGTAPVDAFRPNRFGLYNMSGNVWEWCADWFSPTFHQQIRAKKAQLNPQGPLAGMAKVTKGGSYLCHKSYCNRYRVAARTHNTPDSTTGHMGFRLVADDPAG